MISTETHCLACSENGLFCVPGEINDVSSSNGDTRLSMSTPFVSILSGSAGWQQVKDLGISSLMVKLLDTEKQEEGLFCKGKSYSNPLGPG